MEVSESSSQATWAALTHHGEPITVRVKDGEVDGD